MTGTEQASLFSSDDPTACLVRLDAFEGPLDLLLHLIRKNEVDICNIPIAEISRQYLDYLDLMRELNLDVAGEFLVMASTLIQIKSQMLLPSDPELLSEDEHGADPRAELVRRLLEYERYREASELLSAREMLDRDVFARNFVSTELEALPVDEAIPDVELFDLLDAFRRILARTPKESFHEVGSENISIADRISDILDYLKEKGAVNFESLFEGSPTRELIVASFLAILELCKLRMIRIVQFDSFGTIMVSSTILVESEQE